MWHPFIVTLRSLARSLFPGIVLLALAGTAHTQARAGGTTGASNPRPLTAQAAQLSSLQQAQARALASGDSSAVATTSRALAAHLLKTLATLERSRGETAKAAELEEKAHLLDGASDDHSAVPSSKTMQKGAHPPSPAQRKAAESEEGPLKKVLAQCLNDLGTAEARQGDYAAAKIHFEEATHWDVASGTLLRNLGTAAFRVEDFPTAVRALGQYLQPTPSSPAAADPRSQLMYALSLFSTGNFSAAAHAFAPVGTDAMRDPRSAYSWAFSLAHAGDPKQANTVAAELSAQPLAPDVLSLVCHIFMDTESYEQSADCYRKVIAADPSFRLAHYQIAESLIRMDRPGEALPELRKEIALSPDDPNVQYSMAFALLQTSNKEEAFKLLRIITAAHPEMAQPQYQFGKLLLEAGNTAEAIAHLELAEQADGSLDYVHYQLQASYRKIGRTADADREARLYREIKAHRRDLPSSR